MESLISQLFPIVYTLDLSQVDTLLVDSVYLWCDVLKYMKYDSSASDKLLNVLTF